LKTTLQSSVRVWDSHFQQSSNRFFEKELILPPTPNQKTHYFPKISHYMNQVIVKFDILGRKRA